MDMQSRYVCVIVNDFKTHAPSSQQNEQEKASTERFKIRHKQE